MESIKKMFKRIDLTTGKPWKVLLIFSIPILISLILNNAFSLINSLVLKTTVGGDSVSAINSTGSITNVLFNFAFGISGGFTIVMSEHIGKKDYSNLKKIFYNAIYLSLGIGVIIGIIGLIFYKDLLVLLNVNDRYFDKASAYYQILLIAFLFMILSNFFANAMRAIGDSFAPLVISIIGTVVNIILAFLFTGVIKLDTKGVALATLIANLVNSILGFIYLTRKYDYLYHERKLEKIDKKQCWKMLKLGLPLGLQWSVLFIGSFYQDSKINQFGDGLATKAVSCYAPFVNYMSIPLSTLGSAMLSFAGQNYGTKDFDRIRQGFKQALILNIIIWACLLGIGFLLINHVPYIFLPKNEINDAVEGPIIKYYCSTYLKVIIPCLIMQATLVLSRTTLQGIQKTIIPFLSGIGELFARIAICAIIPSLINPSNPLSDESFLGICFSTPMAWFVSVVVMGGSVIYYLFIKKNESKILK